MDLPRESTSTGIIAKLTCLAQDLRLAALGLLHTLIGKCAKGTRCFIGLGLQDQSLDAATYELHACS